MKQAIIKSLGVLMVELPEGATVERIKQVGVGHTIYQYSYPNGFNTLYVNGTYIGKYSEMTEDDFNKIVKNIFERNYFNYLKPNEGSYAPGYTLSTAHESFLSAVEAEDWYIGKNPLSDEILPPDIEDWKEAQSRTFNPNLVHLFKIEE